MFCREQAVQLHRESATIGKKGARLVFIGNGNRHFASAFKEEFGITEPVYVDTKRESYRAFEMKRGVIDTIASPSAWKNMGRALGSGFRQGMVKGDAWQLGGVLVVRPGGAIAYRYLSNDAGDHPDPAEVLAAL